MLSKIDTPTVSADFNQAYADVPLDKLVQFSLKQTPATDSATYKFYVKATAIGGESLTFAQELTYAVEIDNCFQVSADK